MDKGYKVQDIAIQAERLDNAHITYNFSILPGFPVLGAALRGVGECEDFLI